MSVYAPLLGHLWNTLKAYGIDPREVIDAKLFQPGENMSSQRRIHFADYESTVARGLDLIEDPAMGVRSSRHIHPSHLGALGHAWLASSSLRTAMQRLARLNRMFNDQITLTLEESSTGVCMQFRVLQPFRHFDRIGDAHLACVLQLCRLNYGSDLQAADVALTLQAPADPAPWLEHYGPVVRFGQDENSLSISAADADAELTGSNPELAAMHEGLVERYLLTLDEEDIVNRIRLTLIDQLPSGRVVEDDLAAQFNMSKRTLHRKLRENQYTFRSILAEVRQDLAQRYIGELGFSVTEVAFMLGYNDTSAFSRAFRNWFGQPPTAARDSAKPA